VRFAINLRKFRPASPSPVSFETSFRLQASGYLSLPLGVLAAGVLFLGLAGCTAPVALLVKSTATSPATPTDPPTTNPPTSNPSSNSPSSQLPTINLPSEQASTAGAFLDSVGVVTHLSYTDTPYFLQFPQIYTALKTLGIKHIRDGYYPWAESNPIVQAHQKLAAAGIKCDYVVPYVVTTTPQAIEQFAPMVRDMESLEGSNECDVSGECNGMDQQGVDNVVGFLPTIYTAGQALGVPVVGPSFTQPSSYTQAGNLDANMTVNNLHVYFGGRNPGSNGWGSLDAEGNSYGSFNWWLDQAQVDGPGMPSEITETGYITTPATLIPFTLPESVAASYTPRTLLLGYQHGLQKTYLYELIDEVSSPGYGLMNADLTPKPAFTAVQNLLSTLSDDGASFSPSSLPYVLSGGDSNLNHLLLQKSDGSYWLVLWLEVPSWDPVLVQPVTVTPESISLELNGAYDATTAYQFDTNGNVSSSSLTMDGYSTSLPVSDQITIVQITPQ